MIQKFNIGDMVRIAKDLGPSMKHFTNNTDAMVVASYNQLYGGGDVNSYSLFIPSKVDVHSWYYECNLTLIKRAGYRERQAVLMLLTNEPKKDVLEYLYSIQNPIREAIIADLTRQSNQPGYEGRFWWEVEGPDHLNIDGSFNLSQLVAAIERAINEKKV